jgi:hypothetical protein
LSKSSSSSDGYRSLLDEPLRLVHHSPGRVRARAHVFENAEDSHPAVQAAERTARAMPGFRAWSRSRRTGSVVVEYAPGSFDPDELLHRMARAAGLRGVTEDRHDHLHREELVRGLLDSVRQANALTREATGGRADLRELVPLALGAASAATLAQDLWTGEFRRPTWENLLWWSQSIFIDWHRREIASAGGRGILGGAGGAHR